MGEGKAFAASRDKLPISILLPPLRVLPARTVMLLPPMPEMEVQYRSKTADRAHFETVPRPQVQD